MIEFFRYANRENDDVGTMDLGSPSSGVRSESRWYGLACVGLA